MLKENKKRETLKKLLEEQKNLYQLEQLRKEEIEELKLYLQEDKISEKKEKNIQIKKQEIIPRKKIDITFYLNALKKAKEEELKPFLDTIEETNKIEIINYLILYYLKEKTELMKIIGLEYKEGLLDEFKEDIKRLDKIIEILIESKEIKIEEQKEENNIMCLTKINGENIIIDDIENILDKNPTEATLKDFKDLLASIIDGTFKGMKSFTNNNKLSGLREVKQNNARIVFHRLDKNTYVIIYMFIKDCMKDKLYQDTLKSRAELYLAKKEELKEQIKEEKELVLTYFKGVK